MCKAEKVQGKTDSPSGPKEVLIKDKFYDVTDFEKKHPGGTIIKYYTTAGDATEAFTEFHGYSKKAEKILASLKHRPASPQELAERRARDESYPVKRTPEQYAALSEDFSKLRAE